MTLVCWRLFGASAPPARERWAEVRTWAEEAGLLGCTGGVTLRVAARPAAPAPRRPPTAEVRGLWAAARAVVEDVEACVWLRGRGIEALDVAELELARVLPWTGRLPGWARYEGRPWSSSHRLLIPLVDARGQVVSLHARSLAAVAPGGPAKAASPAGYETVGLAMVSRAGRDALAGDGLREDVEIVEGAPDFLARAAAARDGRVVGVIEGSWSDGWGARVGAGCVVTVRTHADAAGDRYAAMIGATLGDRVSTIRAPL